MVDMCQRQMIWRPYDRLIRVRLPAIMEMTSGDDRIAAVVAGAGEREHPAPASDRFGVVGDRAPAGERASQPDLVHLLEGALPGAGVGR